MAGELAPVAFFAFNRPEHARRTLSALALSPLAARTDLYVFVDGPRGEYERAAVEAVRQAAYQASGFRSVRVASAERNQGLYAAITGGVGAVLEAHERVVVVEDDVLVGPNFLDYMNDALERYAGDRRVGCIHGYAPPIADLPEFYFLPGGDCWGWATWRDRWSLFRADAPALLRELLDRGDAARFAASHGWGTLSMLARRVRGRNQSWAILWHASLFLHDRLTLHPGRSFVRNIGVDGSGTHSGSRDIWASDPHGDYHGLPTLEIRVDERAARRLSRFMDGLDPEGGNLLRGWARRAHASLAARYALLRAGGGARA